MSQWFTDDVPEGLIIVTDEQTAGRGQRGNTWKAAVGENLTFSLGLRPTFLLAKDQFQLSIAISLGIHDFLHEILHDPVKIKWPNDLYYHKKKLGGILIENSITGTTLGSSVVGIGLNINQLEFDIPTATSIRQITGRSYNLESVLLTLCEKLEARYVQLQQNALSLKTEYYQRLYRFQEWQLFESKEDGLFEGMITGIADTGQLEVQQKHKTGYYDVKEISFRNREAF